MRPFALTLLPVEWRWGGSVTAALPQENASDRALRRNGFTFAGEASDPEDGLVWRWERRGLKK